jgi:MFS family permease
MKTFFTIFLSGVILAVICSILGGMAGALIGGNFGFPLIGEARGYESGGLFFSVFGMVFGGVLGSWLASSREQGARMYFGYALLVFSCGIVALAGYAMLVNTFHFPEIFRQAVLFVLMTSMPFIIARRATRAL